MMPKNGHTTNSDEIKHAIFYDTVVSETRHSARNKGKTIEMTIIFIEM